MSGVVAVRVFARVWQGISMPMERCVWKQQVELLVSLVLRQPARLWQCAAVWHALILQQLDINKSRGTLSERNNSRLTDPYLPVLPEPHASTGLKKPSFDFQTFVS